MGQQTASCLHPINRRDPYRLGLYKCHECGNIIFEEYKSNSSQQTAPEWFAEMVTDMIHEAHHSEFADLFESAKEMFQQQIESAWKRGDGEHDEVADKLAKQYYTKTYGK